MEQTEVYCGPPPSPDTLWSAWNLDPFLLGALVILAGAFCGLAIRQQKTRHEKLAFTAAFAVLLIAFVSPLCALSSALFSARVLHHVLLIACAAPLLAYAFPASRPVGAKVLSFLFLLHTCLVWLWHAPAIYAFALTGDGPYWLMELSLLGSGFIMWRALFSVWNGSSGAAMAVLLGSVVQMGLLGALLTFARRPLYAAHLETTTDFGLSSLADQQLAGLIMWVPAALPYLFVALLLVTSVLRRRLPDGQAT